MNYKFKLCSNSVQSLFKLCSNSNFVHTMFNISGKSSYSVLSLFSFVHGLFKSNKLKCVLLPSCSNFVQTFSLNFQTLFRIQTLFKLCSKVKILFKFSSMWSIWKGPQITICTLFKYCSVKAQTLFKLFKLCSNIKQTSNKYQFYAIVKYTL